MDKIQYEDLVNKVCQVAMIDYLKLDRLNAGELAMLDALLQRAYAPKWLIQQVNAAGEANCGQQQFKREFEHAVKKLAGL